MSVCVLTRGEAWRDWGISRERLPRAIYVNPTRARPGSVERVDNRICFANGAGDVEAYTSQRAPVPSFFLVVPRIENAQFFNIRKIRHVAGRQLISMTDGDGRNLCVFSANRSADALAVRDDLRVM